MARHISQLPGFSDLSEFFEFIEARAAEFDSLASLLDDGDDGDDGGGGGGDTDEQGLPGGGEVDRAWREHLAQQAAQVAARLAAAAAGAAAGIGSTAGAGSAIPRGQVQRGVAVEGPGGGVGVQEQQQEGKQPEVERVLRDWETPEGLRAVQALQSMGAKVYLPGGKDDLDWGVLAGGVLGWGGGGGWVDGLMEKTHRDSFCALCIAKQGDALANGRNRASQLLVALA